MRSEGLQLFGWCLDDAKTKKLGIKGFNEIDNVVLNFQGSGRQKLMYVYKREDELDDDKL